MTIIEMRQTHPSHGMAWHSGNRKTLKKLFKKGFSIPDLSSKTGRSPNSLNFQLFNMNLIHSMPDLEVFGGVL